MKLKVFITDVDGTLTDGKIYTSNSGELMKAFNVKDGLGIKKLLNKNIEVIIMTARNSKIVEERAKELGISQIYQGVQNKRNVLNEIASKYSCDLSEIAYIGDDDNDLECLSLCGYSGCPADSSTEITKQSKFVSDKKGGEGAVRDFIEYLLMNHI